MARFVLAAAGFFEIAMAFALKSAQGWTRLWPSVAGLGCALASIVLLTLAAKRIPVTTAYTVWTGIGAIGVSLVGIVGLGESPHPLRLLCIASVFAGIMGLHLLDGQF